MPRTQKGLWAQFATYTPVGPLGWLAERQRPHGGAASLHLYTYASGSRAAAN
jgi:hypothetical protein